MQTHSAASSTRSSGAEAPEADADELRVTLKEAYSTSNTIVEGFIQKGGSSNTQRLAELLKEVQQIAQGELEAAVLKMEERQEQTPGLRQSGSKRQLLSPAHRPAKRTSHENLDRA